MLSAVEGLEVVAPTLDAYVVPITLVILAMLFSVQRLGTGRVAAVFGPVTALWFLAIAVAGLAHIADDLSVLYALNPVLCRLVSGFGIRRWHSSPSARSSWQ